ncbi:hypothetical protein M011DRAFT_471558 [Sporormia fimetaria CBS 119925]|uniref:DUF1996 domain-containing protein n=1 Tax=Sporormia fimetaria CBS 119925 TaxID=1340428 RepID=A0A6A6UY54_9PLEO|nr:hypothetical protein M011DRAFT_471558 [Sporormia fimetaria CBS 119925]
MKSATQFAAAAALLAGVDAFWRMPCKTKTGVARIDPIVNPGEIAPHAHAIFGGSNFGMSSTSDVLLNSECTSCNVTKDKSAYWVPTLNFIHADGKVEIVPDVGGLLAYYLFERQDDEKMEAFPDGFQMLAGDARQRNFTLSFPDMPRSEWINHPEETTQQNLGLKALGFNCLNYAKQPPEPTVYRHFFPDKNYLDANCPQGVRAEIYFPSCWNGELDSPDHKSHVAYPDTINNGKCPDSHKRRIPQLLYEVIFDTNKFKGKEGQFVFSNGDPTGYGFHADFVMGWPVDLLQQLIDHPVCGGYGKNAGTGTLEDCPLFDNIKDEIRAQSCEFEMPKVLEADDCVNNLCGNVEVFAGPEYAPAHPGGGHGSPSGVYTPPPVSEQTNQPTLSYTTPRSAVGPISIYQVGQNQEAPEPTPAPQLHHAAVEGNGKVLSTSTYTSAGVVHEVVVVQEDVYVTVEVDAPSRKRHAHHMHQRHQHS